MQLWHGHDVGKIAQSSTGLADFVLAVRNQMYAHLTST